MKVNPFTLCNARPSDLSAKGCCFVKVGKDLTISYRYGDLSKSNNEKILMVKDRDEDYLFGYHFVDTNFDLYGFIKYRVAFPSIAPKAIANVETLDFNATLKSRYASKISSLIKRYLKDHKISNERDFFSGSMDSFTDYINESLSDELCRDLGLFIEDVNVNIKTNYKEQDKVDSLLDLDF